jgi:hypothetical protein
MTIRDIPSPREGVYSNDVRGGEDQSKIKNLPRLNLGSLQKL